MGKESRLRNKKDWEPNGTGRKLLDPDAVPEGCDYDIWHLALYFEDVSELHGIVLKTGRPVIYESIKKVLTNLPPPDIRTRARTCGITVNWVLVVEKMIDNFFYVEEVDPYCINIFSNIIIFETILEDTLDGLKIEKIVTTGTRIIQRDREIKPSKRTEEQRQVAQILQKKRTEEEMLERMKEFRNRSTTE